MTVAIARADGLATDMVLTQRLRILTGSIHEQATRQIGGIIKKLTIVERCTFILLNKFYVRVTIVEARIKRQSFKNSIFAEITF